ncbi:hypothetical protein [Bradyrhizobium sp. CER78]|uniref:hypothetical protein n=1 Tax=Bradyrhizobium sp. CER78 TaxID=3039162 RepID=UPI00244D08A4|nr:hypothetical protein [Bradyrhizobium sp. CER78]MDH2381832.1 hypothetical protein [Bradyrhizobium sp. CER78]
MSPRDGRQSARANGVHDTEPQIVDASIALRAERWFDEITLDDIAAAAGIVARSGDDITLRTSGQNARFF